MLRFVQTCAGGQRQTLDKNAYIFSSLFSPFSTTPPQQLAGHLELDGIQGVPSGRWGRTLPAWCKGELCTFLEARGSFYRLGRVQTARLHQVLCLTLSSFISDPPPTHPAGFNLCLGQVFVLCCFEKYMVAFHLYVLKFSPKILMCS